MVAAKHLHFQLIAGIILLMLLVSEIWISLNLKRIEPQIVKLQKAVQNVQTEILDHAQDLSVSITKKGHDDDLWAQEVISLFKQQGFTSYLWLSPLVANHLSENKTVELINIGTNIPAFIYTNGINRHAVKDYIISIMRQNGLFLPGVEIDVRANSEIGILFDIDFFNPKRNLDETISWHVDATAILIQEGLLPQHEDTNNDWQDTISVTVPYPPWQQVDSIQNAFIKQNLDAPEYYQISEYDYSIWNTSFLSAINLKNNLLTIRLSVPPKNAHGIDGNGEYKIIVIDPNDTIFKSEFRERIEPVKIQRIFPSDFSTDANRLLNGVYQFFVYLNGDMIVRARYLVEENGNKGRRITEKCLQYSSLKMKIR